MRNLVGLLCTDHGCLSAKHSRYRLTFAELIDRDDVVAFCCSGMVVYPLLVSFDFTQGLSRE
jgi:hypothetical protein